MISSVSSVPCSSDVSIVFHHVINRNLSLNDIVLCSLLRLLLRIFFRGHSVNWASGDFFPQRRTSQFYFTTLDQTNIAYFSHPIAYYHTISPNFRSGQVAYPPPELSKMYVCHVVCDLPGVIPNALDDLFDAVAKLRSTTKVTVSSNTPIRNNFGG